MMPLDFIPTEDPKMKNSMMRIASSKVALIIASLIGLSACDKSGGGISILAAEENFKVSLSIQARPIDIMWVVDNSGSMNSSQQNLATNFSSFIQDFVAFNYDFRMAVTTTDTWFNQYNSNAFYSPRWRSGNRAGLLNPSFNPQGANTDSGVFVINKTTPQLNSVFTTNIRVGTQGNGDERAFASMIRSLNHGPNNDFRRSDAFLSIIIVSDEEDFSSNSSAFNDSYSNPNLISVANYVSQLDAITASTADNRRDRYQVSNISIRDAACLASLGDSSQKIQQRYDQIADVTGGSKNSLCDSFSTVLNNIKDSVLAAAAVFALDRTPIVDSIVVKVDGTVIPIGVNTWSYETVTNSVRFASGYAKTLSADSNISITYDPTSLL
jgi:hypothetical protein